MPAFLSAPNVYKDAMKRSLRSVAEAVQAQLVGDGAVEVSGIASIAQAPRSKTWCLSKTKNICASALESRAAAVIAGKFAAGKAPAPSRC